MFKKIFRSTTKWLSESSEKALEEAYEAALKIREIEEEHFKGEKISSQNGEYGASALAYFNTELNSHLQKIKLKMSQFKTTVSLSNISGDLSNNTKIDKNYLPHNNNNDPQKARFLNKLQFIDKIVDKYQNNDENSPIKKDIILSNKQVKVIKSEDENTRKYNTIDFDDSIENKNRHSQKATEKTGVLPRSFLRTIDRIKQEFDPDSRETEEEVVKKFHKSRYNTAISIKFLLVLIILPLLVHNLAKITVGELFINPYLAKHEQLVFINNDLQEETFVELKTFEESLHFKSLIGLIPPLSQEKLEEKIKEKADELAEESRHKSANAIKNIFADIASLVTFSLVLIYSKKEVSIVKEFLDEMIYGLSDSAKAFMIILFTDMFVGFHSPHGWEVILEGIGNHFGLPENRDFNFLFIATFPVILDTVFKYWIFRYLNKISPSSVATYKNMNES